jgi:hypothetical protein
VPVANEATAKVLLNSWGTPSGVILRAYKVCTLACFATQQSSIGSVHECSFFFFSAQHIAQHSVGCRHLQQCGLLLSKGLLEDNMCEFRDHDL